MTSFSRQIHDGRGGGGVCRRRIKLRSCFFFDGASSQTGVGGDKEKVFKLIKKPVSIEYSRVQPQAESRTTCRPEPKFSQAGAVFVFESSLKNALRKNCGYEFFLAFKFVTYELESWVKYWPMGNVCSCESNKSLDVLAQELGGRPEHRPSRTNLGSLEKSVSFPVNPSQVSSLRRVRAHTCLA